MWTKQDSYRSRAVTCKLLDLVEQGVLDKDSLIQDLLGWMSESEVAEFARRNDYITDSEDEGLTDEDVEDIMDDYNYVGNRNHY